MPIPRTSYNLLDSGQAHHELRLYAIDADGPSTVFLTAIEFPYAVSSFALVDDHLAVVGNAGLRAYYLQSLNISYGSPVSVATKAFTRIFAQVMVLFCNLRRRY